MPAVCAGIRCNRIRSNRKILRPGQPYMFWTAPGRSLLLSGGGIQLLLHVPVFQQFLNEAVVLYRL